MNVENTDILQSAAIEALERFAFLLADPMEQSALTASADGFWQAQVAFHAQVLLDQRRGRNERAPHVAQPGDEYQDEQGGLGGCREAEDAHALSHGVGFCR